MPQKILYDTDPGVDDAMALLLLARHPEVELVGVTTVFGNATIDTVTRNALYLNDGTPHLQEAACLAGLAATDWTWSARFEDLDRPALIRRELREQLVQVLTCD